MNIKDIRLYPSRGGVTILLPALEENATSIAVHKAMGLIVGESKDEAEAWRLLWEFVTKSVPVYRERILAEFVTLIRYPSAGTPAEQATCKHDRARGTLMYGVPNITTCLDCGKVLGEEEK